MTTRYALGVDIGGTKTAAAIVDDNGSVYHRIAQPTPATEGATAILGNVIQMCQPLLSEAKSQGWPIEAVGVGTAGQVDSRQGVITFAAKTLLGWLGAPVAATLHTALGLPVAIENDVNALALGELAFGAGRPFAEAVYVAVGTGVGGAVVRERRLWRGVSWTGGELGHVLVDWRGERLCTCGQPGHLAAYASGLAITRQYAERAGLNEPLDLLAVAERARAGEPLAVNVIAEGGQILGLALAGLLNVLDPEAVIIGGGLLELDELWWPFVTDTLRSSAMPGPARVAVRPAELGQNAAIVGAAWSALQLVSTQE